MGRRFGGAPKSFIPGIFAAVLLLAATCAAQTALEHEQAGRRYLSKRDWNAAAREFNQSLAIDGLRVDTWIGLGIARWGSGDRQGAIAAFEKATGVDPQSAEAQYNIGLALKDFGENDRAASHLKIALKLKPDYEEAQIMLALLEQQSGHPDRAIASYRQVLKRNPRSADAHNWLGVAYLQKNSLSQAEAEFREAVRLKPDYARAYNNLGSTLAQAGDIPAGIQALRKGLEFAPDDLQLRINLGMALRSKGDAEGALTQFRSLLSEHSDSPELLYQVGQTLRQKGDLPGAIEAFEQALALSPEATEVYYGLGQALKETAAAVKRSRPVQEHQPSGTALEHLDNANRALARADADGAKNLLEQAIEDDPRCAQAYNLLGFVTGRRGDLAGAIAKLNQAVALDPDLADAHYNLGVALWYHGDRVKAGEQLDTALRLNPAAGNVYGFRGMTLRDASPDRARQLLERAIAVAPESPLPYFDLATVFLRKGQMESGLGQLEAGLNLPSPPPSASDLEVPIAELRSALSREPNRPEAYNVLGRLLGVAGAGRSSVLEAFQQAIRLDPEFAEAQNNLGLVFAQSGEDERAIEAFREAVRLRPDFADAHQNLGAVLTSSDPAEAVRELEKAVALQPASLKAQYNLALAYEASPAPGPARAIEQLRKVLSVNARYPRAEFALGKALLRQGRLAEAVGHLQTAVAQEPAYGEARYQLGLALSRSGRQQEGAAEIRKSREIIAADESAQAAALDLSEAAAAIDQGDADQAITKLRRVLSYRKDAAQPYYLLGSALARKGETVEAMAALRQALAIDPAHAAAKRELDQLSALPADDPQIVEVFEGYIRDHRFQELEGQLRAYVLAHPQSAWGWYALGYTLYGQRKIGESIAALAKSLQLDVNNAAAHKALGRALMIIGRFDAAKIEFQQGARLDPKSPEMPYNLGKLYSILDNWADARREFESALRLDPAYMEAYDGLGLALESLGDDAGATSNYKKAIDLAEARHAAFATPYVNLSALCNRTGERDAALQYARRALEVNGKSDAALFQMAKAYEYRGELDAAAEALSRAISLNPRVSSYFYVLATVSRKLGRTEESRRAMESFSKLDRESNALEQKRRNWVETESGRTESKVHD